MEENKEKTNVEIVNENLNVKEPMNESKHSSVEEEKKVIYVKRSASSELYSLITLFKALNIVALVYGIVFMIQAFADEEFVIPGIIILVSLINLYFVPKILKPFITIVECAEEISGCIKAKYNIKIDFIEKIKRSI